ncbi:HAD family acid phosphatase [Streptomyces rectiviolaceus]|uniref:HAD family acid phosphatase n=1 Tax=Streptomyces rectiviolaceus TaxID=332591 RepID=A0ABP6MBG2_9ACTN
MTMAQWRRRVGTTVAVATICGFGVVGGAQAAEPAAQPAARATAAAAAGVDYGTWQRDVLKVTDEARPYLEQRIEQGAGEKQAIVLDIDNTSLETHFDPFPPTPAVKPVLDLAKYANDHGVAVFFVTARPDLIELVTKANLKSVGYPVAGLYQRSIGDLFGSPAEFKAAKRAQIEGLGYTIIANIGNNGTDFEGGHAERTFKLPDYDGQLS